MAAGTHVPRQPDQTMVGVVFNADGLSLEQAAARAWQVWMERLDPAELRGAALYDAALSVAGGHAVFVIAISAGPAIIRYVRDAFAAPDLLAFPGIAPIPQRFMDAQAIPREQLVIRGYISAQGQFLPIQQQTHTAPQHPDWQANSAPQPGYTIPASPRERDATSMLEATSLDGATLINLRLWTPSHTVRSREDQSRRRMLAILGAVLIFSTVVLIAFRLASKTEGHGDSSGRSTPNAPTNGPQMVIAPLVLRASCTPGLLSQFTISNNGSKPLAWSSNAAQFEPPLSLSALNGSIAPGSSLIVQFTTSEVVAAQRVDVINVTSNGGNAQVTITIGGCQTTKP